MDINFHYFTVKALAVHAGFSPEDAQLLAEYSQFTDDYTLRGTLPVTWAPREAIDCGICTQSGNAFCTQLLPTGFSMFDTLALLAHPDLCRRILVCFHFAPAQGPLSPDKHVAAAPALPGQGDLINRLLEEKRKKYLSDNAGASEASACHVSGASGASACHVSGASEASACHVSGASEASACHVSGASGASACHASGASEDIRRADLLQIGVLLHIFADSYAHQLFSGDHCRDINDYQLEQVTEHLPSGASKDVTQEYRGIGNYYALLPAIGHATVGHAPDVCNVSFTIRHQEKQALTYSRDNRETFLTAAENIYQYLCSCTGSADAAAFSDLREQILRGFYANSGSVLEMEQTWSGIFPEISFHYDKDAVLNRIFRNGAPPMLSLGAAEADAQTLPGKPTSDDPVMAVQALSERSTFDDSVAGTQMLSGKPAPNDPVAATQSLSARSTFDDSTTGTQLLSGKPTPHDPATAVQALPGKIYEPGAEFYPFTLLVHEVRMAVLGEG